MIELFKFLSFFLTAGFGVFGSVVQFRRDDGKISRKGRISITGVLLSAGVAASLQIYEDRQAEQDMFTLLQSNSSLLADMNRALSPLDTIKAEFLLEPDWTNLEYAQIWKNANESHRKRTPNGSFGNMEYPAESVGYDVIADTLCQVSIDLLFYKTFISNENYNYDTTALPGELGEDLRISLDNPCENELIYSNISFTLDYDFRDGQLNRLNFPARSSVGATGSRFWRGNGKIISIADLPDTQLIIQLNSSGYRPDTDFQEIDKLRQLVGLRELVLRLPNGLVLAFDADNLKGFENDYDHLTYEYQFPSEMADILANTYYDQFKLLD